MVVNTFLITLVETIAVLGLGLGSRSRPVFGVNLRPENNKPLRLQLQLISSQCCGSPYIIMRIRIQDPKMSIWIRILGGKD